MPRGKKKSVDDHLAVKQAELEKAKQKVKVIETEIKELLAAKSHALSVELAQVVSESGLTIEEAIAKIKG